MIPAAETYDLSSYSTFAVTLKDYGPGDGLRISQFSQALQALPSLHTLSVSRIRGGLTPIIAKSLRGRTFASVQKLAIPRSGLPIAQSCPNTETLAYLSSYNEVDLLGVDENKNTCRHFLDKVVLGCPSLTTLRGFSCKRHSGRGDFILSCFSF